MRRLLSGIRLLEAIVRCLGIMVRTRARASVLNPRARQQKIANALHFSSICEFKQRGLRSRWRDAVIKALQAPGHQTRERRQRRRQAAFARQWERKLRSIRVAATPEKWS